MSIQIKIFVFAICLVIGSLGCGKGSKVSYPLSSGAKWNYKMSSHRMPPGNTVIVALTNLPQREIQGTLATPVEMVLTEHQSGRQLTRKTWSFFISENEDGLFGFIAGPSLAQYYIIKRPIAVGENWTTTAPFSWPPMNATSIVERVRESVTVPAGVFNDCLKIKVLASPAKPEYGNQSETNAHLWFAAGVGLVKATYQTSNRGQQNDEVIVELESYQN